jgi:hypothetical protein
MGIFDTEDHACPPKRLLERPRGLSVPQPPPKIVNTRIMQRTFSPQIGPIGPSER